MPERAGLAETGLLLAKTAENRGKWPETCVFRHLNPYGSLLPMFPNKIPAGIARNSLVTTRGPISFPEPKKGPK